QSTQLGTSRCARRAQRRIALCPSCASTNRWATCSWRRTPRTTKKAVRMMLNVIAASSCRRGHIMPENDVLANHNTAAGGFAFHHLANVVHVRLKLGAPSAQCGVPTNFEVPTLHIGNARGCSATSHCQSRKHGHDHRDPTRAALLHLADDGVRLISQLKSVFTFCDRCYEPDLPSIKEVGMLSAKSIGKAAF